ncbi:hypothetical protein ACFQZE_21925 [Paenibacillus sp. GCM10027627]|uniref:hypothetical protein n=1 Tax=unclassified Paenibacillus TaxID=185978 RepID=UPI00362DED71
MLELLLLIIGFYVMAAVLVHVAFWVQRGRRRAGKHYVLIADQGQKNMEWHLRRLFSFSKWMGKDVKLTVLNRGATEETLAIVERWRRSGKEVHVHAHPAGSAQHTGTSRGKLSFLQGDATGMMWLLQAEGIVSEAEHAVLVDLQNPADLSKMPF